jgi:hypothetical protein
MYMKYALFCARGFVLAIGLALMGCKPVPLPEVRMSSSPKVKYRVSVTLPRDIRLLESPIAEVTYAVANREECVPFDNGRSLGGSRPALGKVVKSAGFARDPDGTYWGIVYADKLLDENYYGLAICHWQLNIVNIRLVTANSKNDAGIGVIDQNLPQPLETIFACIRQTIPGDLIAEGCRPGAKSLPNSFVTTVRIQRI